MITEGGAVGAETERITISNADIVAAAAALKAAPFAETETERGRQRAVRSMLGVSERMRFLGTQLTSGAFKADKVSGELEGMAAWVEAFTLQLAGVPIELTPTVGGELSLASVQLERLDAGHTCRIRFESEGLLAECPPVPSRQAALATTLVTLALRVLERLDGDILAAVQPERDWTREAEDRLLGRLSEALVMYHDADLVPELSCHGMPEDG